MTVEPPQRRQPRDSGASRPGRSMPAKRQYLAFDEHAAVGIIDLDEEARLAFGEPEGRNRLCPLSGQTIEAPVARYIGRGRHSKSSATRE